VSDRAGEARLYRAEDIADTGASLYGPGPEAAPYEVCRTVALDDFCREQGLPFPALIKMDVEGAELAALKGAAGLLAAAQPLLLLEMEDKTLAAAGASRRLIQELLRPLGYRAAFLRKGRWRRTDDVGAATGRNIFWFNPDLPLHREKLRLVPVA
jgi:hypothetical protein